jgi:hypothetical protein
VVDDLINRAKDGEPVDWRYYQGEDFYFIIKAPQLTIHIRKHFVPNGEWTLHPTKIGVTLSLYEWNENQNCQLPMCTIKDESYVRNYVFFSSYNILL